ncbi:MAG: type II toxin-antitoxin system HicB family antitoxin [Synergistaceae bacterium]|jgi:predicted RNase H-like HicB family nuclease|nr:type II toxin-antitoxin system HicB family antitoxin [Synergistaceae bacterium]
MRKKPDRYIFPAVFSYDSDGVAVSFPDLPGCNTCGNDQEEAIEMAKDALAGHLSCLEDDGDTIPSPSDFRTIHTEGDEALVVIEAWMLPLREKTVRKNLTIPARLAYQAEQAGINFSQVLSEALERELQHQV